MPPRFSLGFEQERCNPRQRAMAPSMSAASSACGGAAFPGARKVGVVIGNAHEAEAMLAYHREFPEPQVSGSPVNRGLSL